MTLKPQAFDGLAVDYNLYRSSYPDELYAAIVDFWGSSNSLQIADIGCGTGISTRGIYRFLGGGTVVGVEPGTDMLEQARAATIDPIVFLVGSAEAIPLETDTINIVTAAQAAQWFDRQAFYRESKRIMAPGAIVAIYENNRDWKNNALLGAHEAFLEQYSVDKQQGLRYSRHYRDIDYETELSQHFKTTMKAEFRRSRQMSVEEFYKMATTSTQFKRAEIAIGVDLAKTLLLKYASKHINLDGLLNIDLVTCLYAAK